MINTNNNGALYACLMPPEPVTPVTGTVKANVCAGQARHRLPSQVLRTPAGTRDTRDGTCDTAPRWAHPEAPTNRTARAANAAGRPQRDRRSSTVADLVGNDQQWLVNESAHPVGLAL